MLPPVPLTGPTGAVVTALSGQDEEEDVLKPSSTPHPLLLP